MMEWTGGLSGTETFEEVAQEKRIRVQTKTAEEIAALCVDVNLSPIEKALFLLRGAPIQRERVYADLAKLAKEYPIETMNKIIPLVSDEVTTMPLEQSSLVAASLATICKQRSLPESVLKSTCLPLILTSYDHWEARGDRAQWFKCLIECVPHLPLSALRDEILKNVLARSQHSQPPPKRVECARLIGVLSPRMLSDWLEEKIVYLAKQLCQDLRGDVRTAMAASLQPLCRAIRVEASTSKLLPDLLELLGDDEERVSLAALETLVPLLDYFPRETCQLGIVGPITKLYADCKAKQRTASLGSLAKNFGPFIYLAKDYLPADGLEGLLDVYCWMAAQDSDRFSRKPMSGGEVCQSSEFDECSLDEQTQCRHYCAYNLPAVASVSGQSLFGSRCLSTVRSLLLDDSPVVRRTLACGLHELVRLASPNTRPLLQIVVGLLKDDSGEVVQAVLKHFPDMLKTLTKDSPHDKAIVGEIAGAMLVLNKVASLKRDWRLHRDILLSWACMPQYFPEDIAYGKFSPLLIANLHTNRVLPVKVAAARAFGSFIIYARKLPQRVELCQRILQGCGQGRSSQERSLFLDICREYIDIFSRSLFKEYFFDAIIVLGKDRISNIREKVCRMLPQLKLLLTLPADRARWQSMEKLVQDMLVTEEIDSVASQVRQTRAELDRCQIRVQSVSGKPPTDAEEAEKERNEMSLLAADDDAESGRKSAVGSADIQRGRKSGSGKKISGGKSYSSVPGQTSPATLGRRTSLPGASPSTTTKTGRSTSGSSIAGAASSPAHSNGSSSNRQPSSAAQGLNRQLSGSGGAGLLAASTGSVRAAPTSPAARLKASSLKESSSRRVNSLSALDSCGRDGGGKSGDSPSSGRQVKLPAINTQLKQNARLRAGMKAPAAASKPPASPLPTGSAKKPPSVVLPPYVKNTRHPSTS